MYQRTHASFLNRASKKPHVRFKIGSQMCQVSLNFYYAFQCEQQKKRRNEERNKRERKIKCK